MADLYRFYARVTAAQNSRNHTQRSHSTHRRERHRTETIALIFPWNSCPRGQKRERAGRLPKRKRETRCDVVAVSETPQCCPSAPFRINNEGMGAGKMEIKRERKVPVPIGRNCVVENLPNSPFCMQWRPVSPQTSRYNRSHGCRRIALRFCRSTNSLFAYFIYIVYTL